MEFEQRWIFDCILLSHPLSVLLQFLTVYKRSFDDPFLPRSLSVVGAFCQTSTLLLLFAPSRPVSRILGGLFFNHLAAGPLIIPKPKLAGLNVYLWDLFPLGGGDGPLAGGRLILLGFIVAVHPHIGVAGVVAVGG